MVITATYFHGWRGAFDWHWSDRCPDYPLPLGNGLFYHVSDTPIFLRMFHCFLLHFWQAFCSAILGPRNFPGRKGVGFCSHCEPQKASLVYQPDIRIYSVWCKRFRRIQVLLLV